MQRVIPRFLAAVLLVLSEIALSDNTPAVQGVVKDSNTGETLPGANVVLVGTSLGASSDIYGNYVIRNVPSGTYTIRASYIGYASSSATLK
ncbi:MAG TPA: carboxypeptidase-like regulatory domain-containing protein, partial [Bacteroidota bacterium]|nr:carboxypeptidase-like regulatory domain-containing protein [Bacteroidota bacterium]